MEKTPYGYETISLINGRKSCAKAKCLYNGMGREREECRESAEMKNKRKYNRKSKVELPKRYRKNKK